jgi:hypothetical protein
VATWPLIHRSPSPTARPSPAVSRLPPPCRVLPPPRRPELAAYRSSSLGRPWLPAAPCVYFRCVSEVVLKCFICMLRMLKWLYTYVASICFKYFSCFRRTFHAFHLYVLCVSFLCFMYFILTLQKDLMLHTLQWLHTYVSSVCSTCFICIRRMLQMFQLVQTRVSSRCCNNYTSMFQLYTAYVATVG